GVLGRLVVSGAPRYRRGMLAQDLAIYTALMDRHGSFGQTLRVPRGDRRADYATACGLIAAYPDTPPPGGRGPGRATALRIRAAAAWHPGRPGHATVRAHRVSLARSPHHGSPRVKHRPAARCRAATGRRAATRRDSLHAAR